MVDLTQTGQRYSASEVSARIGLPDYVLKLWEIQFPQLRLQDGTRQTKGYSANEIALLSRIKKLLYVDHMSIEKARKTLQWESAFPVQDPIFMRPTVSAKPAEPEKAPQSAKVIEPAAPVTAEEPTRAVQTTAVAADAVVAPATMAVQAASPSVPFDGISNKQYREKLQWVIGELESIQKSLHASAARESIGLLS